MKIHSKIQSNREIFVISKNFLITSNSKIKCASFEFAKVIICVFIAKCRHLPSKCITVCFYFTLKAFEAVLFRHRMSCTWFKAILKGLGSDRSTKYSSPPITCSSTIESGFVCVVDVEVSVVVVVVDVLVSVVVGFSVEMIVLVRLSQLKFEPFQELYILTLFQGNIKHISYPILDRSSLKQN